MKQDWMKNFSVFVLETRKKLGMNQEDLAKATGMNTSYICRLEKGTSFQSVKVDFLVRLADAFEMTDLEIMKIVGLR